MRRKKTLAILPLMIWFWAWSVAAPVSGADQPDEEVRSLARQGLEAVEDGNYEFAYKAWYELYSLGATRLGEELMPYVRSMVYLTAFRVAEGYVDDCSRLLTWTARGTKPGPPEYSEPADAFYPFLLVLEGACQANTGSYEQAFRALSAAREHLPRVTSGDTSQKVREVNEWLRKIEPHVISSGTYVTNNGSLQRWIGRVIRRRNTSLEIRLTYVSSSLNNSYEKGEVVTMQVDDCKKLGGVSIDAATKGWKEPQGGG